MKLKSGKIMLGRRSRCKMNNSALTMLRRGKRSPKLAAERSAVPITGRLFLIPFALLLAINMGVAYATPFSMVVKWEEAVCEKIKTIWLKKAVCFKNLKQTAGFSLGFCHFQLTNSSWLFPLVAWTLLCQNNLALYTWTSLIQAASMLENKQKSIQVTCLCNTSFLSIFPYFTVSASEVEVCSSHIQHILSTLSQSGNRHISISDFNPEQ